MVQKFVEIPRLPALKRKLTTLGSSILSKKLMGEIGFMAINRIDKRTARGLDVNGQAFKPYSPAYRLFRMKNKRPVNIVNLNFYGTMMGAMTADTDKSTAKIFFTNTSRGPGDTPAPQKAFFLNQTRNFFALSQQDVEDIVDKVQARIKLLLRK
jgi:phage gpG-like protein